MHTINILKYLINYIPDNFNFTLKLSFFILYRHVLYMILYLCTMIVRTKKIKFKFKIVNYGLNCTLSHDNTIQV